MKQIKIFLLASMVMLFAATASMGNTVYEAEGAEMSPAFSISTDAVGYTGTGFVDYSGEGYIKWTVTVAADGNYDLGFRYALSSGNLPLSISVDSSSGGTTLDFPATGSWTTWGEVGTTVALTAGTHTVYASTTGVSGADMDHLTIESAGVTLPPDATTSAVAAAPASVVADGTATSTVTVTVKDANNNPVTNATVSLAQNGTSSISAVTNNNNGTYAFTVSSPTAQTVTYTATANSVEITETADVTFTPGAVTGGGESNVTASPTSVSADGSTTSTITVTVKDANNNPVTNATVSLAQNGTSTISAVNNVGDGTYTFSVSSTTAQTVTYTATANGVVITETAEVTFTDITKPIITLIGANPQILTVGDTYTELGATASDDEDGNITGDIIIDATAVNINAEGNYTVTYNVSDAALNAADTVTRTVEVLPALVLLTTSEPLVPANCLGDIEKSGLDLNRNGVLDAGEVTSTLENYTEGPPLTRAALDLMIANGEDVTTVNTCKITDMSYLFRDNTTFNQDISGWNTGSATNMFGMFWNAQAFNQPIDTWDVSSATNISGMFVNVRAFNQPIGTWDVYAVTTMTSMFGNVTLSVENYDNLLIGWSAWDLNSAVTFSGGNSQYSSAAQSARELLTDTYSWRITDGGLLP